MITSRPQPHAWPRRAGSDDWQWPVDLTRYQRPPFLCDLELQALDRVMNGQAFPRVLPAPLEHVLLPVQEALSASHTHPRVHCAVRRIFLTEMHKRRRSFWNWTPEEWTEILCSTAVAFADRYPGPVKCRQQVLTVAYLLCGFTDFHRSLACEPQSLLGGSDL
jgi:hypothetical protein